MLSYRNTRDNTINKIMPTNTRELEDPHYRKLNSRMVQDLFTEGDAEDKVKVRILGPEALKVRHFRSEEEIKDELQERSEVLIGSFDSLDDNEDDEAIVIHVHGGGFISMSSSASRVYISRWIKKLKIVHFSIDYRLSPKNKYPDALDDVWQAYLWILNYAHKILGTFLCKDKA